jgi:hypothetical protein
MCDNCPTPEQYLQFEIDDLKQQLKQLKNFLTGVPAPKYYKYKETELGYKLVVDDEDVKLVKGTTQKFIDDFRQGKMSIEEFEKGKEFLPPEELTMNQMFSLTYLAKIQNLVPDSSKLLDRLKFKKGKK